MRTNSSYTLTDRQTDSGNDNTPSAILPRGKKIDNDRPETINYDTTTDPKSRNTRKKQLKDGYTDLIGDTLILIG